MSNLAPVLLPRATHKYGNCTVDTCPVSDSIYGYYPSKPVNLILATLFGISLLLHIWQGVKWRSWTFLIAQGVGTLLETAGM